nr:MAG TPA_asm: hypothetical protein [Caudoviricetes sp.]
MSSFPISFSTKKSAKSVTVRKNFFNFFYIFIFNSLNTFVLK